MQSSLVQTYIAKNLSSYLSQELKTKVAIDKVEVHFFMNVVLKGVYVEDLHKNILLKSDKINAKLDDFGISGNYIHLRKVVLENTFFNLRKYKDENKTNLQFIIDYFKTNKKETPEYPFKLFINDFKLINSGFSFLDENKPHTNKGVIDFKDVKISQINIKMQNVGVLGDSVCGNIMSLSLHEKCGFIINSFSADVIVSKRNIIVNKLLAKTENSVLDLDLAFLYDSFRSFKNFLTEVNIQSSIRPTSLNLIDIAYFARGMYGMNDLMHISAAVKGKVSNFKVRNFVMKYGYDTYFDGDVVMNGLPHIKETFINLKIRNLTTSVNDLNRIIIPAPGRKITHLSLPSMLQRLGHINVKGIFTGFYSNFVSNATLNSDLGTISTDIILKNENKVITYDGRVLTENFFLGKLLNSEKMLGRVSLNAQINGSGLTANDAAFLFKGNIQQLEFKDYNYSGINIDGDFNKKIFSGKINVNDVNLAFGFNGTVDFNDSLPVFNFIANVGYANLKNLKLDIKDTVSEVKGKLKMNFHGNNIDNLKGEIAIENAAFRRNNKYFDLNSLNLNTDIDQLGYRTFNLKSDYIGAVFKGYFVFSDLGRSFKSLLMNYLPNLNFVTDTSQNLARQEFDFDIKFDNASPLLSYFVTGLGTSGNTLIKGRVNSIMNIAEVNVVSSKISFKKYSLENLNMDMKADGNKINMTLNADTMKMSDSAYLLNFGIASHVLSDSINTSLVWDNKKVKTHNAANLNFYYYFIAKNQSVVGFKPSEIVINDSAWNFSQKGNISIDSNRITFNDVMFYRKLQGLQISGSISKDPLDALTVKFHAFDISNFDYLTNIKKFDFDGYITGDVIISDLYTSPTYYSDLKIKDFGVNGDKLGDASILSKWDDIKKGVKINAEVYYLGSIGRSTPLNAYGYYYPGNKPQNFDIQMDVQNMRLKALNRYISGFGSVVDGTASGKLFLLGKKKPELSGLLRVMRGALKINYLNTVYNFSFDSVKVTPRAFTFKNIIAFDQPIDPGAAKKLDTVIVSGVISHEYFRNMGFDVYVDARKALCLNTNPTLNSVYYGTGYATGNAHLWGDSKMVSFDINAATEKGSKLIIPVGTTSALQTNDYITFVRKDQKINLNEDKGKEIKGLSVDMSLNVTDVSEVQLLFDPRVGDRILGMGNGNIRLTYNNTGLSIFGDYVLTSGDYLFTFQNIINKRFIIEPGSTIKWNGDPYNAEMDIRAKYKLRANLAGLGVDTTTRYVPVECIINMTNVLANPEYTFEVDLPSLQDYEKIPYLAAINENVNNNFISLLVINSFVNPNAGIAPAATAGTALGKSASEVLSNQLSNWLSQISKNVNIGINYRPGDNISEEEVAVALSTQLFNDRVSISSNVGVATGQNLNNSNNKNTNQIVGDVDIEVKINKALKMKFYNHTNQNNILQYTAPYTQGIGILYRKEFNTYRDLFLNKKKAKTVNPPDSLKK